MKRMDSLKRPETIISLINTAALLGASIYFYKKINNLELELNKHSEHLTTTVKKVKEMTIYKKHIAALGNAIKELNGAMGNSYRDVENLKQLVKFQAEQITELHTLLSKLELDNKLEFKQTDNPYLRYLQYQQQPQSRRIQQAPTKMDAWQQRQQQFQQPSQQQFQQQQFQQPQQQQFQQPQFQQYQPPQQQFQQQQFQQPPQQQFHQQQQLLDFNDGFSQDMPIDDEDAAIDAVRRARQQNEEPLNFF